MVSCSVVESSGGHSDYPSLLFACSWYWPQRLYTPFVGASHMCMRVCILRCMYTHIHMHAHTLTHACMHAHTHAGTHIRMR